MKPHVIVIGNEKGGSGKSTVALHVAVGLVGAGRRVACLDLDRGQGTLARNLENRAFFAAGKNFDLPGPGIIDWPEGGGDDDYDNHEKRLAALIAGLGGKWDILVIDTPGADSPLARAAHSFADVIATPLNDSFIDLDVLGLVDRQSRTIAGPGRYAEMVWEQKKRRALRDGGSIDWVVLRNRLSSLDARNKRELGRLLAELSGRIGFRLIGGLGERVIFRELFHDGLTVMDLDRTPGAGGLNMSRLAARQEVRTLIEAVLPASGRGGQGGRDQRLA